MNQTLTSYVSSDASGAELSLAVNLNLMRDSQYIGNYQELGLITTVMANTKKSMDYSYWSEPAPTSFNSIVGNLVSSVTIADNQGLCVPFPSAQWFYGAWYNRLYVSDNGYVVFDSKACSDTSGKFNRATPPTSIPSGNDGGIDSFIAPFWRNFKGATVRYGTYADTYGISRAFFGVAWINVQDSSKAKQSFLVGFEDYSGSNMQHDPIIEFVYGNAKYSNGLPYAIGMEDQNGRLGKRVDPTVTSIADGNRVVFSPYSDKNDNVITRVKVSASKWITSQTTNDQYAQIDIKGQGSYLPAGINIVPQPSTELLYTHYPDDAAAWNTAFQWGSQQLFEKIPYTGTLLSMYELLTDLGPACDTANPSHQPDPHCGVSNPATPGNGLQAAYSENSGMDQSLPNGHYLQYKPWSLVLLPVFVWSYDPTRTHYIDVTAEIDVQNFMLGTFTTMKTTQTITLKMNPRFSCLSENPGAHWSARTSLDRHSYNFNLACGNHAIVYHVDSTRAGGESSYLILGWARTTSVTDNDYRTDSLGRLTVQGYFKADTPAGSRVLNVYAIDSKRVDWDGNWRNDNLDNVIKTVPIISNSDPTGWNLKQVLVDLGPSYPNWPVKIGIGRLVDLTGVNMAVEWQGLGNNADMVVPGPPPTASLAGYAYTGAYGVPLSSASVVVRNTARTYVAYSGSDGSYRLDGMIPDSYTVDVTRCDHYLLTTNLNLPYGTTTYNPLLFAKPKGTLQGYVRDGARNPLVAAYVGDSSCLPSVSTDTTGHYSLNIIADEPRQVLALKSGYTEDTATVTVPSGSSVQHDFTLFKCGRICPNSVASGTGLQNLPTYVTTESTHRRLETTGISLAQVPTASVASIERTGDLTLGAWSGLAAAGRQTRIPI